MIHFQFNFKFKLLIFSIIFILLATSFNFVLADEIQNPISDEITTNEENLTSEISEDGTPVVSENESSTNNVTQSTLLQEDLYICEKTINITEPIYGNVYAIGDNVTINTNIIGNLFVLGKNITLGENAAIQYSVYLAGSNITCSSKSSDLYVVSNNITITNSSKIYRDLKVASSKITLNGEIGRNVYLLSSKINFDTSTAKIYGDLNYSSSNELPDLKTIVEGNTTYDKIVKSSNFLSTLKSIIAYVLLVIIVFIVLNFINSNFIEKSYQYITKHFVKSLLLGLLFGIIAIVSLALSFVLPTIFGLVGIVVLGITFVLLFISKVISIIAISSLLAELINTTSTFFLSVTVSIVLSLISLIPFVGLIINVILSLLGCGIIVRQVAFKEI